MENIKKSKKDYESTKLYTKKYNASNINVQLDRELIVKLRNKLGKGQSIKQYIESLIISNI